MKVTEMAEVCQPERKRKEKPLYGKGLRKAEPLVAPLSRGFTNILLSCLKGSHRVPILLAL
jgi:hypothetical protein